MSIRVEQSQTVAVVGESGSGKSTLARAVMRLVEPDAGSVSLNGNDLLALDRKAMRRQRRAVQMVFQDPYASLDPLRSVAAAVGEPFRVHDGTKGSELDDKVGELLAAVGLDPSFMRRLPSEMSGGQRQRVSIARALALNPSLIIADEAVSALDVSTQSEVLNLFMALQARLGLSYLFISHDLSVVRCVSHVVAVMYLGQVVEYGPTDLVYSRPLHPYTKALISAVPIPNPRVQAARQRIVLSGDVPSPTSPPTGCRFNTRCPSVMPVCREVEPALTTTESGVSVACHLHPGGQSGAPPAPQPVEVAAVRHHGRPLVS